jgi:hypothetical protein
MHLPVDDAEHDLQVLSNERSPAALPRTATNPKLSR